MTRKLLTVLALGLALAACEKEKGAGFTGIGATSQSSLTSYSLDFDGLALLARETPEAVVPTREPAQR